MKEMKTEKQATICSLGGVFLMFTQWLISVLLARLGGFADAGVFSLAMSISNVFTFFGSYGMRNYQVSDTKGRFTQGQYLYTRAALFLAAIAGCAVYLAVTPYTGVERAAIFLYLLYSFWLYINDVLMASIQLHGHLEVNGYANLLKGAVCFPAFIVSYLWRHDLLFSLGLMVLATAFTTLTYELTQYKKYETPAWPKAADGRAVLEICRICFPLMVASLLPVVVQAYPRRLINLRLGNTQLGYYSSLFAPTALLTTMMPTLIIGFVPQVAETWQSRDRRGFLNVLAKCYGAVIVITLLAEAAVLMAGRPVMRLVFGEEIMPYFSIMYYAVLASGLNTLTVCGRSILTGIRKSTSLMVMSGIELLLTVALSGVFIDRMGILGAAIVMIVSYSIHTALQAGLLAVETKRHFAGPAG